MGMPDPKVYTWIPFGRLILFIIKSNEKLFFSEKNISKDIFPIKIQ